MAAKWQSNANKAIKDSRKMLKKGASIGEIIDLIKDMTKLKNEGTKYDDIPSKNVLKMLLLFQAKIFKLGTQLGADLASMRAKSNFYVDHPVYGRLRY